MKKNIIFAAVAALSLTACVGDLDQNPLAGDAIPSSEVYSNPVYRKGMLAKIYGGFTLVGQSGPGTADIAVDDGGESEFLRAWWSIQTISTDECKCVWGNSWNTEVNKNAWTATKNSAIYATYTRGMMMVSFANDFLRNTSDDDPEIAGERAEVRFLRAFAYWVMLDCFGNPPFVTESDPVGTFKPLQTHAPELFAWIKSELTDLTSANSKLKEPHTQVYPRIDKGAAYGLLARLCLNHKTYLGSEDNALYTTAYEAADKVIAAYPLAQNYAALFMGDNGENPDALREIVYASCYDAYKTQSYGGPTYLICAGQGEEKKLGVNGNWNGLVSSTEAVTRLIGSAAAAAAKPKEEFDFTTIDKRALLTLLYSDDKALNGTDFAKGWHVTKFNNNRYLDPATDYATKESFASVDFPMIRAAEMYLVYAEAQARIGGGSTSDAKAVKCITDLQERAGLTPTLTSITLSDVFTEISREMFYEGLRRTTLIRFGYYTSADFLWPLKGGVKNGQAISDYLKLFPLPSDDLQANGNLVQNTGYANN